MRASIWASSAAISSSRSCRSVGGGGEDMAAGQVRGRALRMEVNSGASAGLEGGPDPIASGPSPIHDETLQIGLGCVMPEELGHWLRTQMLILFVCKAELRETGRGS